MKTEVNPVSVHGQENDFPLRWMVYWNISRCVNNILQTKQMVAWVFVLLGSYLDFGDLSDYFHRLYPDWALGPLNEGNEYIKLTFLCIGVFLINEKQNF